MSSTLRAKGYEVPIATDAPTGLAMADAVVPNIIIIDLTSTTIAEASLISEIRRSKRIGATPIIVLTSRVDMPDRRVHAAVLVPIEAGELLAAVRAVLGAPEPAAPQVAPPSYPKGPTPLAEPIRLNGTRYKPN